MIILRQKLYSSKPEISKKIAIGAGATALAAGLMAGGIDLARKGKLDNILGENTSLKANTAIARLGKKISTSKKEGSTLDKLGKRMYESGKSRHSSKVAGIGLEDYDYIFQDIADGKDSGFWDGPAMNNPRAVCNKWKAVEDAVGIADRDKTKGRADYIESAKKEFDKSIEKKDRSYLHDLRQASRKAKAPVRKAREEKLKGVLQSLAKNETKSREYPSDFSKTAGLYLRGDMKKSEFDDKLKEMFDKQK